MKIGIIRCDDQSHRCAGYNCFPALRDKTGTFKDYDSIELVGFDSCGGCGRGKPDRIVGKAQRLKERGAEVIHLGDCIIGSCPHQAVYLEAINKELELPVVASTHGAHH